MFLVTFIFIIIIIIIIVIIIILFQWIYKIFLCPFSFLILLFYFFIIILSNFCFFRYSSTDSLYALTHPLTPLSLVRLFYILTNLFKTTFYFFPTTTFHKRIKNPVSGNQNSFKSLKVLRA